ncbi:MAG: alternative ribosome rescue aminoacyl-tRNA hydrolase ArfB [Phycisphaerae bacterium]
MGTPRLDIASLSSWIEVRFSRSAGPGGQNVNKVSTRVTLLFDVVSCTVLTDVQKTRIRRRLRTRISRDGLLRVVSQRERTQARNRVAAEIRLIELLTEATHQRKSRRRTQPTAGSRERRLESKRRHGEVKRQRKPTMDD